MKESFSLLEAKRKEISDYESDNEVLSQKLDEAKK
jgi:hypothetical protein